MTRSSAHSLTFPIAEPAPRQDREASGLLDLRALARALHPAPASTASAPAGFTPSLGAVGVLLPRPGSDRPAWLVPTLVVGGLLVLTALGLTIALVAMPGPRAPHLGSRPAPALPRPVLAPPPAAAPAAAPRQPVAPVVTPETAPAVASPGTPAPRRRPAPALVRRPAPRIPAPAVRPGATPRPEPVDPVAEALRRIGRSPVGPATPGQPAELPAELSAGQIQRGASPAVARSRACGRRLGATGTGAVKLQVEGATGAVLQATVTSGFAGPLARCVAEAFRGARFARFQKPRLVVYYTVIVR